MSPEVQTIDHPISIRVRRSINVGAEKSCELRLCIADDDSSKPLKKHGQVVARIASDQDSGSWNLPLLRKKFDRRSFVGSRWKHVKVAVRAVNQLGGHSTFAESKLRLMEPARLCISNIIASFICRLKLRWLRL